MSNFKNSILIVAFNYSDCLNNKDYIIDLYKEHFKKIIIYSDFPERKEHQGINYVDVQRGFYIYRIFNHFYQNYKEDINSCDGLFYVMDDAIINLNLLHLYDNEKIITTGVTPVPRTSCYERFVPLPAGAYQGNENMRKSWGQRSIDNLAQDPNFKDYNINEFYGQFADYFYLPKEYLTKKLFDLFELFSKHEVFLELAIPTAINNIEKRQEKYNIFNECVLWQNERKLLNNKKYIEKIFNTEHNLFVHPIKFNSKPEQKLWIKDILCKEKCVVITTINKPTETILKHINNKEYDVIIVGDKKTPNDYKDLNCIFLDIEIQNKLFAELSQLIPLNHYGRKNLGYLYAIKKGYKVIYETDDDNIPHENFDAVITFDDTIETIKDANNQWINIFKYFTNNNWIWPRGYPLSQIKKNPKPNFKFDNLRNKTDIAIVNGLVENDPDVDAIFRLICNHEVEWEKDKKIIVSNENTCPFNTQNTFWLDKNLFLGLLIPCSVTFRYCDILKGIIANTLLRHNNKNMAYTSPNVTQLRNEHDLMQDFESEVPMYLANENIVNQIKDDILSEQKCLYLIQASGELPQIYQDFKNNKEFVLLSYKNKTADTNIFLPNSTWTTGRNALREYALKLDQKYDYYIFLDEDIVFTENKTFDDFELLLNLYRPYIGNPTLDDYGHQQENLPFDINENNRAVLFYDGACNAFCREAFLSSKIFPYIDKFDNKNWWASQWIMIMLCRHFEMDVRVFNHIRVENNNHSKYPRNNNFDDQKKFMKDKMNVSVDELKFATPKGKPISPNFNKELMLNIYQKLYDIKIITELDIKICKKWLEFF